MKKSINYAKWENDLIDGNQKINDFKKTNERKSALTERNKETFV